jgi:hypothetical protein
MSKLANSRCAGISRRSFLSDTGMGFTGLALSALLAEENLRADRPTLPHHPPKIKSVIWLFMCGGVSHVESFDPKSALNKYAGKSIADTPYADVLKSDKKDIVAGNPVHGNRKVLMGLNTGVTKHGKSGLEVGDWWKNVGTCADDLAVVRSLWTSDNDHGAQLQFQTGRHVREGAHPTLGSWACYGLGTLNQNLPQYAVLGVPTGDCCGGEWTYGSSYLGAEFGGVRLNVDAKNPLPFISADAHGIRREEQLANLSLLGKLNTLSGIDYPNDPQLRARIKSYELAFGMQAEVPETMNIDKESEAVKKMYGLDQGTTAPFGKLCLGARRLVERGVRFVQIFHGGGGGGAWDAHGNIKGNHSQLAAQVDLPIAGLLKDLKQRGMLKDTLVVWGTEFGRSPGAEGDGRDHHPQGFCAWLAGGGIKGGTVHGKTDELGYHAVEDRHYITDIHATVLHLLGLDSRRLEIPGRKRLELDFGKPIQAIMA